MAPTNSPADKRTVLGVGLIAIGVFVLLGVLWGGSYVLHRLTFDDWRAFPTFMTLLFAGIGGIVLCAFGSFALGETR